MYAMIGIKTKEIYAKGKTRSECFRTLQRNCPYYKRSKKTGHNRVYEQLYPEALTIIRQNRGESE